MLESTFKTKLAPKTFQSGRSTNLLLFFYPQTFEIILDTQLDVRVEITSQRVGDIILALHCILYKCEVNCVESDGRLMPFVCSWIRIMADVSDERSFVIDISTPETLERDFYAWLNVGSFAQIVFSAHFSVILFCSIIKNYHLNQSFSCSFFGRWSHRNAGIAEGNIF